MWFYFHSFYILRDTDTEIEDVPFTSALNYLTHTEFIFLTLRINLARFELAAVTNIIFHLTTIARLPVILCVFNRES